MGKTYAFIDMKYDYLKIGVLIDQAFHKPDGSFERKANCDVDMAFYLMKEKDDFDSVIILSGDGDFLHVKYLRKTGKKVFVLARGKRTAREIKQFAGGNFRDFKKLGNELKFE